MVGLCLLPGEAWGRGYGSLLSVFSLSCRKLGESRDTLLQWSWMESHATPGTCEVFNKHFVFINFLTKREWLLAFLLCCIIPGLVPVSLIHLPTHL